MERPTLLVDDALLLYLSAGHRTLPDGEALPDEGLATTGGWYFRLCRSLFSSTRGHLTRLVEKLPIEDRSVVHRRLANPASMGVTVVGFPTVGFIAAKVGSDHGLDGLNAEIIGAAMVYDVPVVVTEANQSPRLADAMRALGLPYRVLGL